MATWEELLQQARTLKDQVLPTNAAPGHVKTATHNPLVEKLIALIETHAADQAKHTGSLPAGALGDMLVNDGTNWLTLAAGALGQLLEMKTVGETLIPQWVTKNLGNDFQLFYDDNGYCYLKNTTQTGLAMSIICCKNVWLYDQNTHLKRYLAIGGNREFTVSVNSLYGISRAAFATGTDGNVTLNAIGTPVTDDYILINRTPVLAGGGGQLAELAALYSAISGGWNVVSVTDYLASLDFTNIITSGRFRIDHNATFNVSALPGIVSSARDGFVVVKNTHATDTINVQFIDIFNAATYQVAAGKTALYMYARLTAASNKYTAFELVPGTTSTDTDENVKVGASGTADYLNESHFQQSVNGHILPKITQGKMWQGGANSIPVEVDPPSAGVSNIIANKGVGLTSARPASGLVVGDIFVSTDDKKKYTATAATTWDAGVALTTGVFINDTSLTANLLYQYNGTVVKVTGDGGGAGGDITLNRTTPTVSANAITLDWASKNVLIANKSGGGGGIDVATNATVTLSNTTNADQATIYLNVTANSVLTFPANVVSSDTRWNTATQELALLIGWYTLVLRYDRTNFRLSISDIEG